MKMKKTMIKNSVALALLAMLTFQCSYAPKQEERLSPEQSNVNLVSLTSVQIKNAEIALGKPVLRSMKAIIKLNGVVDVAPADRVYVSNPFGGFVKKLDLYPGSHVKRGALLVVMEDPQYIQMQQDYLMAKTRLKYLALDFERQQNLNTDKSISDKTFQQTTSEYTSQKILVKSLEEKLRLINIAPEKLNEEKISRSINLYSPIEGYVSAINASIGKYVTSTESLFELTDEKTLHASLNVFEKDLPQLSVGQRIKITSPARPGKEYFATIHTINRSIAADRSSEVHCDFDKPDKDLLPGMFISADLAIAEDEVQAVPEEAIVNWENKQFVFTHNGSDQFEMTPVKIGKVYDGYAEVLTDLEDKQLVIKNAYSLLMKLKNSEE